MSAPQSILSRAISVYSLPPSLLANLSVRSIQDAANGDDKAGSDHSKPVPVAPAAAGSLKCQTCPGAGFETVEDQRQHFKSDWHRYNAKAKLTGRAVTAEEWDGMVEGISSISGSASSSSSSGSSDSPQHQSKLSRLLARQTLNPESKDNAIDSDEEAEIEDRKRRAQLRTAVVWFSPSQPIEELGVPKDTQFGVHRALFPRYESAADYLNALRHMQLDAQPEHIEERRITMLMVAGGHFAGMVVGLRPKSKTEKQEVKGAGDVRVIHHKTFHRYTTRKKQGGSQGLNDNSKSKAISAGAMLRRYGEQALQEEIRALLSDWSEDIEMSERIFIRASTHGKKSFWGYEGAVLDKTDERIRTFPFPTRRPTQQELLRCWHELTRVKISHLSEETLAALDEEYIASLQPKTKVIKPTVAPAATPAVVTPKLSPEEEAKLGRSRRIDEMVRKGRIEPLKPLFEKHPTEFEAGLLGVAASSDQEEMIKYLLLEAKLDPTVTLENGRKAYEMASSKGVRNAFRRIAYDNPDLFDWTQAKVPSGLSEEAEAAQNQKKADRRKGMREKLKERAASRAVEEEKEEVVEPIQPAYIPSGPGPQKLGGAGSVAGLAGLSADMRQQIERERRARAAEARFKTA